MKRLLTAAVALFIVLLSCRKDFAIPGPLVSGKYRILSSPKVYTKNGEVTDKAVAENFVKSWVADYFFFKTDTAINYPPDTILFRSLDTAIFRHLQPAWGKRIIKQQGDYYYFYQLDTLIGYKRMDNVLNDIVAKIGVQKPYYKNDCAFAGPSCFTEWVYDAYIATGTPTKLELPLLTYKITRRVNGLYTGVAAQNYNNVFDPAVLHLLQDGDTLAIQTASCVYLRLP